MFNKAIYISMLMWYLLPANAIFAYTRADSLRGGNGSGRNWWNVERYELSVTFDTAAKSIKGSNKFRIRFTGATGNDSLQIDLQEPMVIDSIVHEGHRCNFVREGNVWWVLNPFGKIEDGRENALPWKDFTVYFHGSPKAAVNPPWDGGFIWTKDSMNNAWYSVGCQGLGASVWWPCKDIQSDEPDKGMSISLTVPEGFDAISNGGLGSEPTPGPNKTKTVKWYVANPVNTYNVSFYIGNYIHWQDTFHGENGTLELDFYALRHNEAKARKQFAVTKEMLRCFEYWMGPYPFYEDGYKLVEAPFLGMEHQSAIAYGNKYQMGYLGRDRSGTGVGLNFDFIIIHETGHEWYGNNITAADIADNWIHEGFTTYSETLFSEWILNKEKAFDYVRGQRKNIQNDKPVIAAYGVQGHGSGDMYDKGAALVHTIRVMMHDDKKFRSMLRGMNEKYYHKSVSSAEIEEYINKFSGIDFRAVFDQYLRTTNVPELEYAIKNGILSYKFNKVVTDFTLPIQVTDGEQKILVKPTAEWQQVKWKVGYNLSFSKDFYYTIKS
jgi:aminopeptidase N